MGAQGLRWIELLSSPLIEEAKAICKRKPSMRYSLAEILDELLPDDQVYEPVVHMSPTREDKTNVRHIYAFFGYTDPQGIFDETDDDSDGEHPDVHATTQRTNEHVNDLYDSDNSSGSSIISCSDDANA